MGECRGAQGALWADVIGWVRPDMVGGLGTAAIGRKLTVGLNIVSAGEQNTTKAEASGMRANDREYRNNTMTSFGIVFLFIKLRLPDKNAV